MVSNAELAPLITISSLVRLVGECFVLPWIKEAAGYQVYTCILGLQERFFRENVMNGAWQVHFHDYFVSFCIRAIQLLVPCSFQLTAHLATT